MRKRGDNGPATAKLGKFGTALEELRARLQGQGGAREHAKSQPSLEANVAPDDAEDITARKRMQERLLREAEMARLAFNPAVKPSWANRPKNEVATKSAQALRKKVQERLICEAEQDRAAVAAATRSRMAAETREAPKVAPAARPDPLAERMLIAARLKAEFAAATSSVEPRPANVSEATRETIGAALKVGAEIWTKRAEPDLEGYIVGLDLGTSAVKCAYRQPYRAGDPVRCMTVPQELRSFGHPCLWQTVIWYHPETQTFALTPSDGAIALEGFKSGLIRDQGRAQARDGLDVSKAEAMSAFIAMQLAYILGAYERERPLGPTGAEHYMQINFGIPVAAHDDSRTRGVYAKMVSAARSLAANAANLTPSDVRQAFANAQSAEPPGITLIPELVAAMSAYVADPTAPDGAHFLVDVGASTLDMVAFNLIRKQRLSVFTACVETLGAAALEHARATNVSDTDFKRACDDAFEQVYGGARKKAPTLFHPAKRKDSVQLITTGGGCQTPVHEPFIEEMTKPAVLGDWPIVEPLPPSHITEEKCDKSRLLVAYGLTRDLPEFLTPRLPSDIGEWQPAAVSQPEMITKDAL